MRGKLKNSLAKTERKRNIPAYAGKTEAQVLLHEVDSEHPRVCGENFANKASWNQSVGTSPRMRGKLGGATMEYRADRNIPAYAGKTYECWFSGSRMAEHPRVCGENRFKSSPAAVAAGTSPRMRGKPWLKTLPREDRRNIPAYAGKTLLRKMRRRKKTEHPRVCGENQKPSPGTKRKSGTSPRMRGKL